MANAVATLSIAPLTVMILFRTDNMMDMILNSLALTFIRDLDNGLVSVDDEEEYVLRFERYLNIAYVQWTLDVDQWGKGFKKGFRRKVGTPSPRHYLHDSTTPS